MFTSLWIAVLSMTTLSSCKKDLESEPSTSSMQEITNNASGIPAVKLRHSFFDGSGSEPFGCAFPRTNFFTEFIVVGSAVSDMNNVIQ